jgi:hypothetical protein
MDPHFILSTYAMLNEWMNAFHEPGVVLAVNNILGSQVIFKILDWLFFSFFFFVY